MNKAYLYWVHLPNQTNFLTEGYIGVTLNTESRFRAHFEEARNGRHSNLYFSRILNKYKEKLIQTIVLVAPEEYCYFIENKVRQEKNIGWNIAEGGCKPPPRRGLTPWNKGETKQSNNIIATYGKKGGKSREGKFKRNPSHFTKGRKSWNRGLSKKDPRVAKYISYGNTNVRGKHWFNNGQRSTLAFSCPLGYKEGRRYDP